MKENDYAIIIYLDKYISRLTTILSKYSNKILNAYTKIYQGLKTIEETTVRLPIQSIKLAFQPTLHLHFQSQQFLATLTKLSVDSACLVLKVCYVMKLYFISFPSVPCGDDTTRQALHPVWFLHNLSLSSKC